MERASGHALEAYRQRVRPTRSLRSGTLRVLLPPEHVDPLLERLRAAESARLGDASERLVRLDAVPDEPAPDDDAGAAAARPAVHVDDAAGVEFGVDLVENADELGARRDREVADRAVHVARGRLDERAVRLQLAGLREVDEERDAGRDEVLDLEPCVLRAPGARMSAGDDASLLDDGGRAHEGEVCRVPLPRPGGASQTRWGRCR